MRAVRIVLASAALLISACSESTEAQIYVDAPISPFMGTPMLGDPKAPVELTEYASTTCSHCKAFHDEVFPQLKARYIDTGKIRLVWSVMPTQPTAISIAGAAIARCAGEQQFFPAIDALFEAQDRLFDAASNPRKVQQQLNAIGGKFGLSPDQVGTCIDSKEILALTREGVRNAPESITGTPSFAIRGEKIEVESFEGLAAAIDAELAKSAQPASPT